MYQLSWCMNNTDFETWWTQIQERVDFQQTKINMSGIYSL